uniref:Mutant PFC0460w n=1 Tax=Plasmodium falciparum (isolate 3D7) TaxID=36329 RepID=G4XF28_PLAF7|nr:mutant PFC0460w [Plasmodium falciparum 3D7]
MYTYITYLNIYFIKIRMMMNPTLGKPEEDLAVYDYTDISMNVCLKKYEYIFDPWTNDSRVCAFFNPAFSYLFMTIGFIGMFVFYKMKNDLSMGFIFACIFLVSFSHYIMCIICSYIITKDVIKSVETRIKSLNIKYKKEKIYFKLINLSSFGLKYLKLFTLSKGQAYFTLRVIYKYCKII